MESKDRRLQERFSLQLKAKLTASADVQGKEVNEEVTATNISAGGAFIATTRRIPLASKVYLEFLVDFEQLTKLRFILSLESLKRFTGKKIWVRATGVVIRQEEEGLGVIFDQDYQLSPMESETDH